MPEGKFLCCWKTHRIKGVGFDQIKDRQEGGLSLCNTGTREI